MFWRLRGAVLLAAGWCALAGGAQLALGQTITFPQPAEPAYAGTSVLLTATDSSGLGVTYKIVSGPGAVSGAMLSYTGAGTVVVEADEAPNGTLPPTAAPVQDTVTTTVLTEPVGTASGVVTTVVAFTAAGTLGAVNVPTQGAPNKDFKQAIVPTPTSTCMSGTSYAAGQTCEVYFTFTPSLPGMRYGGITLTDANGNVLANSYVYGIGVGPQVNYVPGVQSTLASGFTQPAGLAFDGNGNLFVADHDAGVIVELLAASGYTTENTISAGLTSPVGIAVDGSGNLFVAENNTVSDVKEIFAAGGYTSSATLGSGFNQPVDVAVDGNGNVFVADDDNNAVKEITVASGYATVLTLAGSYNSPTGVAVDGNGNVFVADDGQNQVKEILAASGYNTVNTLPGSFPFVTSLKVDASGNVFVCSLGSDLLQEIFAAGGYTNVETLGSNLAGPEAIALDGLGNVFLSDYLDRTVVKLDYADGPTLNFAATVVGATSSDSPQTVTVTNNGNAGLDFLPPGGAPPGGATNPSITAGFTFTSSCPVLGAGTTVAYSVAAGGECAYAVSFAPASAGQNTGKLVLTDDNLNVAGATQTVLLNGLGTAAVTGTLAASPEPSPYGASFTLNATITQSAGGVAPTGTVTFSIDGATVGSAPVMVDNGVASATYPVPAYSYSVATPGYLPGVHTLAAEYSGDANYGALALSGSHTVTMLPSDASLTNLVTTIFYGQEIGLTNGVNAVASAGVGAVGGTLTVYIDGNVACVLQANINGQCPDPPFKGYQVGVHEVTVGFSGDAIYAPSTSAASPVQIIPDPTATVVSSSPNASTFGENVTLTATTANIAGFTDQPLPAPAGPVVFYDGGTAIGTAMLNAQGVASLSIAKLAVGMHNITASYAATLDFNASASGVTQQQVNPAPGSGFTMTVTPTTFSTYIGVGFAATVTITETGGYNEPVQLSCSGLPRETTCAFDSATIAPGGGVTRLVMTPAAPRACGSSEPYGAAILPLVGLLGLAFFTRRRRLLQGLLLVAVLCAIPMLNGCGSGNCTDLGTKPGSYTFRVTGTATGSAPQSQTQGMKMTVTS